MPTRILIVEDSSTQAEALRVLLEGERYDVTRAASGEEALRLVAEQKFDLVLSDIVMPGIGGFELCRRIKGDLGHGDLPVVFVTDLGDPMDIVRGLECGADNYIVKPYEPGQLLARARSVLDNRALRRSVKSGLGVSLAFMGNTFTITSGKEQILDLLMSSFEDVTRTNGALLESQAKLAEANAQLEAYGRRMANQARVTGEKYWTLMQHASEAIFVLDRAGRVLEANARGTALLGRQLDSLLGQPLETFVLPDEVQYFQLQFGRLEKEERLAVSDLHLLDASGSLVCCDLSASLVRGEGDAMVLVMLRDVSDRNRAQREVAHADKLAAIGTLTAGIAHELNNPLAFLVANTEQILVCATEVQATVGGDLGKKAGEMQVAARESLEVAKRLRDILRDLKQFAHGREDEVASIDINQCLDAAANMATTEIKYRATLVKDYGELPPIVANATRLVQVFLNLLINAAHAIEEGGPARNQIKVESRAEGDGIRVSVSDTGKGIPPEERDRIFEPFYTTKPVGTGTGLGLPISKQIVDSYRGQIAVTSEVGQGTTMTVRLPRDTGLELPASAAAERAASPAARQRVLLVDDEAYLLRAYERVLARHHDVTAALGGRRAIEIAASAGDRLDVVITDLLMPDVDGIDLHAYLRDHHPTLASRTVFVTGGATTLRAREFLASLKTPWLEKPFEMDQLLHAVSETMGAAAP